MSKGSFEAEARRLAIVPIVIPHSVDLVLRTVEALAAGGARGVEIVLRTSDALPALAEAKKRFPDLLLGAGTILTKADYDRSVDAGADFTISPGFAADLVEHARGGRIPLVPGVQTSSEVMTARAAGVTLLKFYPAEPAGGVDVLADFASVFPDVAFMPSGKINAARLPAYLALRNVASVGGTWMHTERGAPLDAVEVKRRMAEAMALAAGRP